MNKKSPIGIFDSGLGGLTVVKEITKLLPKESIIYFGDTARVPYGTKSKRTIEKFSCQNVHFLTRFKVKLIIVACNTSSSLALPLLKRTFKIPIIGVIESGVKEAILMSRNKRIGVIGTRATISSGVYKKTLRSFDKKIKAFSISCPLFVPLVEEGWLHKDITEKIASYYLRFLKEKKIDSLILGCTHYPLLKLVIKKVMGEKIKLVDSALAVAKEAKHLLEEKHLESDTKPKHQFFVSDEPLNFSKEGSKFLGKKLKAVKKINYV